ncbi:MAG TPA: peptidoglycan DD-metalloendopeptidase family protein [Steroidobacteraceae bacterium]|nr:peptidoglycan DD-metalloendopeptidase family protein [Steroidobacteraceae bacterium]
MISAPRSLRLFAAVCALVLTPTAQAAAEKAKEAELASVRERIETIRKSLQAEAQRRDALTNQLKDAELGIASARERLAALKREREAVQEQREALEQERQQINTQVESERDQLAAEMKLAYLSGREEQLRMVLNQRDPARLGRNLVYYRYFGRLRADRIHGIEEQLDHIALLSEKIAAEEARLAELQSEQEAQVGSLKRAREQRAATLATVQSQLKTRGEQLSRLEAEAKALEKLIAELRRAAEAFPTLGTGPFARVRGKLPWPVKGRLLARFGQARGGGLKWQGVLIGSARGTQVRASYGGRVMYADWLPGLGLLIVIDHGGGFMSLYGNNEELFRKVGDRVAAGDAISVVGEGSASHGSGLYFEVRKGRQPLDPLQWLSKP